MGMLDLEKKETENTPVQAMGRGNQEQEPLILADLRVKPIEGGIVAAKTKPEGLKRKWLPYWLLVAVSAMVLTSHLLSDVGESDGAAAKDQLMIAPVAAKFAVFLGAICLLFCAMKQVM